MLLRLRRSAARAGPAQRDRTRTVGALCLRPPRRPSRRPDRRVARVGGQTAASPESAARLGSRSLQVQRTRQDSESFGFRRRLRELAALPTRRTVTPPASDSEWRRLGSRPTAGPGPGIRVTQRRSRARRQCRVGTRSRAQAAGSRALGGGGGGGGASRRRRLPVGLSGPGPARAGTFRGGRWAGRPRRKRRKEGPGRKVCRRRRGGGVPREEKSRVCESGERGGGREYVEGAGRPGRPKGPAAERRLGPGGAAKGRPGERGVSGLEGGGRNGGGGSFQDREIAAPVRARAAHVCGGSGWGWRAGRVSSMWAHRNELGQGGPKGGATVSWPGPLGDLVLEVDAGPGAAGRRAVLADAGEALAEPRLARVAQAVEAAQGPFGSLTPSLALTLSLPPSPPHPSRPPSSFPLLPSPLTLPTLSSLRPSLPPSLPPPPSLSLSPALRHIPVSLFFSRSTREEVDREKKERETSTSSRDPLLLRRKGRQK